MSEGLPLWRLRLIACSLALAGLLLLARVGFVQFLDRDQLLAQAADQPLGVPLHAEQQRRVRVLDRLDDAGGRPRPRARRH